MPDSNSHNFDVKNANYSLRQAYGKPMASLWQAYGKPMASLWQAYGKPTASLQLTAGLRQV